MHEQKIRAVFSDVDGTLLNTRHRMTPRTLGAVRALAAGGIPFAIISARSAAGIAPIIREYDLNCTVVCYSGALILDEGRKTLFQKSFSGRCAKEVAAFLGAQQDDVCFCLYSYDDWMVQDKHNPRIVREERIVKARARQVDFGALAPNTEIHKILCICNPVQTNAVEAALCRQFPDLSVVKSSDILLEVMAKGVNKAEAVKMLCSLWSIDLRDVAAFGDNYNDAGMLEAVGYGFLMANAPQPLRERMPRIAPDNDHDGIYHALRELGVLGEAAAVE